MTALPAGGVWRLRRALAIYRGFGKRELEELATFIADLEGEDSNDPAY